MDEAPLGTEVDLGPGHIVLGGVPAPAKGAQQHPLFSAHVYCGHGRPSQLLLSSCTCFVRHWFVGDCCKQWRVCVCFQGVLLGAQVYVCWIGTCVPSTGSAVWHWRSARPDTRQHDAYVLWAGRLYVHAGDHVDQSPCVRCLHQTSRLERPRRRWEVLTNCSYYHV